MPSEIRWGNREKKRRKPAKMLISLSLCCTGFRYQCNKTHPDEGISLDLCCSASTGQWTIGRMNNFTCNKQMILGEDKHISFESNEKRANSFRIYRFHGQLNVCVFDTMATGNASTMNHTFDASSVNRSLDSVEKEEEKVWKMTRFFRSSVPAFKSLHIERRRKKNNNKKKQIIAEANERDTQIAWNKKTHFRMSNRQRDLFVIFQKRI